MPDDETVNDETIDGAARRDPRRARPLGRLWAYAVPFRRRVQVAGVLSVTNKLFDLAPPLLIGLAVDVVANDTGSVISRLGVETAKGQLVVIGLLSFFVWAMESLFDFLADVAWRNIAQDLQHELRVDAYAHVQTLDHDFFEGRRTGDLLAATNDDVNQLERFLDIGAHEVIQVITTVVAIGAVFFGLAPQVAWWSFLPMPVILWGSFWFQRRLEPRYQAVREQAAFLNSTLANNLLGISTVKSFVAERRERDRVATESDVYRERNAEAIRLSAAFIPLIRMAILVGFTATLVYGGFLAAEGRVLSVGEYSVMVFLSQRLLWPLTRLGETFDQYQRAMASATRILDLVATPPAIVGGDQPLRVAKGGGELVFDDVRFTYGTDEASLPALDGVSMTVPAGSTVAVVGATGSGKSTLVKLLLRFYDPQEGSVRIDGHDLRDVVLDDLRAATGLVSQDVYLFHGSVAENVAYGKPDATADEIAEACRIAEAHEFVVEMPDGYDTIVGERGQRLSGGQRQRLSIARAVLKDPPILLLDEATSAVDNETEAAIQRSLDRVARGRTTFVIAHRLSTIRHADVIHVLDRGRVIETGTHDELVALDGAYAALWRVQTGEHALSRD